MQRTAHKPLNWQKQLLAQRGLDFCSLAGREESFFHSSSHPRLYAGLGILAGDKKSVARVIKLCLPMPHTPSSSGEHGHRFMEFKA